MARYRSRMPQVTGAVEQAVGLVDEVKNMLNVTKVKRLFRLGTEVIGACQPFIEKPTYWNAGRVALGVGKVLVDDVEVWSENYFDGDEWTEPYSRDFNLTILQVLTKYPFSTLKTAEDNTLIRLIDLEGAKIGWTYHTKLNTVDHIYVETDKLQQARDTIKRLLWEQFKGEPLVMRHNRKLVFTADEPKVVFEVDDDFHPLPSAKASEYAAYLKRCLDAGVPRSVMLHGPPGTGKSTTARTLVENLQLRSFRIRVEDVAGLENSTLFEAITIFEPDAVILDDFDRAHGQAALLETMQFFKRHVKLVVATVNDKNNLDEALLRPGRFDELVLIDKMDEGVVRHMLGEYEDGYDDVKDWPIAFIEEYCQRRRFMDPSEAAASMAELARRVKRLDKYRELGDNWENLLDAKLAKRSPKKLRALLTEMKFDGAVIPVGAPDGDEELITGSEDSGEDAAVAHVEETEEDEDDDGPPTLPSQRFETVSEDDVQASSSTDEDFSQAILEAVQKKMVSQKLNALTGDMRQLRRKGFTLRRRFRKAAKKA